MSFEYLPHTADLRAVIGAAGIEELYDEAVRLVRDVLVGDSPVRPSQTRDLALDAEREPECFFRFVRELLFLYDSEGFLPAEVELGTHTLLDGAAPPGPIRVVGEHFDAERHHSERQVKALTRHEFSLEHQDDGYRAVLLFDL